MITEDKFKVKEINSVAEKLTGNRSKLQGRMERVMLDALAKMTNLINNDHQPMHLDGELERVIRELNENLDYQVNWWRKNEFED